MPYTTNEHGDPVYKVSKYSKWDLPTWNEIHEEFLKNKWFDYDPEDKEQQEIAPYENRPKRMIMLEKMANQLNKMLREDGWMEKILECFRDPVLSGYVHEIPSIALRKKSPDSIFGSDNFMERLRSISFRTLGPRPLISDIRPSEIWHQDIVDSMRNGGPAPTKIQKGPLKEQKMVLALIMDFEGSTTYVNTVESPDGIYLLIQAASERRIFETVLNTILQDVIDYHREPIGFKDRDGFLVDGYNAPEHNTHIVDKALG
jgi:hypothetical protein